MGGGEGGKLSGKQIVPQSSYTSSKMHSGGWGLGN